MKIYILIKVIDFFDGNLISASVGAFKSIISAQIYLFNQKNIPINEWTDVETYDENIILRTHQNQDVRESYEIWKTDLHE